MTLIKIFHQALANTEVKDIIYTVKLIKLKEFFKKFLSENCRKESDLV